jgi:hypothetical protein
VCAQTLTNWVEQKAQQIDAQLVATVASTKNLLLPEIAETVDLYAPAVAEVLVLTDGICVKAQNPHHHQAGQPSTPKIQKRHDTDVMLFEGPDGRFTYLAGSADKRVDLAEVATAYLRREWGAYPTPLPVVVLTDGAKKIREDVRAIFGVGVSIILDWYHLSKRVYEQLSMSAHSRTQREEWERSLLGFLWHGQVQEVLSFLASLTPRNAKALADLVGYIEKHATEIIDYGRRQATGKPIGSGRMEKAVDQVIGIRQKKKGMSWSQIGSHALALLKIEELNGRWEQLWSQPICVA